jgi:hypothetical protein
LAIQEPSPTAALPLSLPASYGCRTAVTLPYCRESVAELTLPMKPTWVATGNCACRPSMTSAADAEARAIARAGANIPERIVFILLLSEGNSSAAAGRARAVPLIS